MTLKQAQKLKVGDVLLPTRVTMTDAIVGYELGKPFVFDALFSNDNCKTTMWYVRQPNNLFGISIQSVKRASNLGQVLYKPSTKRIKLQPFKKWHPNCKEE